METYEEVLKRIDEGQYDGYEGQNEGRQAWFFEQVGLLKSSWTLSERQRAELFLVWAERQHTVVASLRQTAPLRDPCKWAWDAYQKVAAEAAEARKRAGVFSEGRKSDTEGDWMVREALEASQRADDAFRLWLDCRRANPIP